MDPFASPPTGEPVSSPTSATPAASTPDEPSRRGRMALVALLTAGLVGGGIAGVSALASADRPETTASAVSPDEDSTDQSGEPDGADDPASADESQEPEAPSEGTDESGESEPSDEGELVFDLGDGDPIVLDLGDLDEGAIDRLQECVGFPSFDVTWGELGEFEPGDRPLGDLEFRLDDLFGEDGEFGGQLDELFGEFGEIAAGDSVTVTGPDGVSVVDLGENGSVTVTKEDGEVEISTSGDATVSELGELFGDTGTFLPPDGAFDDLADELEEWLDEWSGGLPDLETLPEFGGFEPIDPAEVQSCLDEVLGD